MIPTIPKKIATLRETMSLFCAAMYNAAPEIAKNSIQRSLPHIRKVVGPSAMRGGAGKKKNNMQPTKPKKTAIEIAVDLPIPYIFGLAPIRKDSEIAAAAMAREERKRRKPKKPAPPVFFMLSCTEVTVPGIIPTISQTIIQAMRMAPPMMTNSIAPSRLRLPHGRLNLSTRVKIHHGKSTAPRWRTAPVGGSFRAAQWEATAGSGLCDGAVEAIGSAGWSASADRPSAGCRTGTPFRRRRFEGAAFRRRSTAEALPATDRAGQPRQ